MSEIANSLTKPETTTVTGLEEFFIDTVDQEWTNSPSTMDQGWTLSEAAESYNVTERTIRRWIKEQVISARKVDGPRGPEWRINPGSTMDKDQIHPGSTVDFKASNELLKIVQDLQTKLDNANQQLQAASFRNGYLESQLENHKEQIKLLTDNQHKQGWWARLKNRFTSDR